MKVLNILSCHFTLFVVPLAMSIAVIAPTKAADNKDDTQNAPVTIEATGFLEWDQNKGI